MRVRILSFGATADLWRLPSVLAAKTFEEASAAMGRGEASAAAVAE